MHQCEGVKQRSIKGGYEIHVHFLKTWNSICKNILDTGYAKEAFQIHAEQLDECLYFLPLHFWSDLKHPFTKGSSVWSWKKYLLED